MVESWVDPITLNDITQPVVAEDGYTYDHDSITEWFTRCVDEAKQILSPMTNAPMGITLLRSFDLEQHFKVKFPEVTLPTFSGKVQGGTSPVSTVKKLFLALDTGN